MTHNTSDLIATITAPFTFMNRAAPLAAELRPEWRIYIILYFINFNSRSRTSSVERLHVFNSALISISSRNALLRELDNESESVKFLSRFDPALNSAVQFAIGEALLSAVTKSDGSLSVTISAKGVALAEQISNDSGFEHEKEFLKVLGWRLTEKAAKRILNWGELYESSN